MRKIQYLRTAVIKYKNSMRMGWRLEMANRRRIDSVQARRDWTQRVAVMALSFLLSLYLCEIVSTGLDLPGRFSYRAHFALRSAALEAGLPFDDRTVLEYVEQQRREGRAVDVYVSPAMVLDSGFTTAAGEPLQPASGRARRSVVPNCVELGQFTEIATDRYGFNNPAEAWRGTPDHLLVGDSYAHGFCLPKGNDIATRLRERGIRALNLGHGGNGPLLELASLLEYGVARHPKKVFWLYFEGNDAADLDAEKRSTILTRYLEPGFTQHLADEQDRIDELYDAHLEKKTATFDRRRGLPERLLGILKLRSLRQLARIATKVGEEPVPLDAALLEQILVRARDAVH